MDLCGEGCGRIPVCVSLNHPRKERKRLLPNVLQQSASGLAAGQVCATCSEERQTRPSKRIERRVWVAREKEGCNITHFMA